MFAALYQSTTIYYYAVNVQHTNNWLCFRLDFPPKRRFAQAPRSLLAKLFKHAHRDKAPRFQLSPDSTGNTKAFLEYVVHILRRCACSGCRRRRVAMAQGEHVATDGDGQSCFQAPKLGCRIEVLWRLESDSENGERVVEERWWGAVVQERLQTSSPPVHILLYDKYGEFEEDVARVRFISDSALVDLGRTDEDGGGRLLWRYPNTRQENGISMEEVVQAQSLIDSEDGSIADAGLQALTQLPVTKQLELASGYRMFADKVKAMLGELVAAKGPDYVITHKDIDTIFQKLRQDTGMSPG